MGGPPTPSGPTGVPLSPNGGRRNRSLSIVKENLKKVPCVDVVEWVPTRIGVDLQLRATIDCQIFADGRVTADDVYISVNWWPQPDDGLAHFKYHYVESSGYNCGWHRQPNDHVDGLDHFQESEGDEDGYRYEPISFDFDNPVGLTWEIAGDRLESRILERGDAD